MKEVEGSCIRCLIIDDQRLNVEILSDLLEGGHPEVEVIGRILDPFQAVEQINQLKPDLVLLDVEMPGISGFDVLSRVDSIDFQTIFVTAYSQYAIQAIRFNALDYLLKPIKPYELAASLKRYKLKDYAFQNQSQVKQAITNLNTKNVLDQILFLPSHDGGMKFKLGDIVKISGERNYSTIHLSTGRTKLSSKTLGYFEAALHGKGFYRCHRSIVVNGIYVEKLKKDKLYLTTGDEVTISRRRLKKTKDWYASRVM